MTEGEVIRHMRAHLETHFPKVCGNCKRSYPHLRDYLLHTKHLGPAMPYDADAGNWTPDQPVGLMTYAQCACQNTLVLTSEGMPLPLYWRLLLWAKIETLKRNITPTALLNELREKICWQVLEEPGPIGPAPAVPLASNALPAPTA